MIETNAGESTYGVIYATNQGTVVSTAISAAATWGAFSLPMSHDKTINSLRLFIATYTGTLAATDIEVHVFSNTIATHQPNASLASSATFTGTMATGNWIEFTGFSQALVANTVYWVVVKNVNGTPASNNITIRNSTNASGPVSLGGITSFYKKVSTDSGGTWGSTNSNILPSFVAVFSDGSYAGSTFESVVNTDTDRVYSARELGDYFTTPNAKLAVKGVGGQLIKSGTTTGDLRFRMYEGTSLVSGGTTTSIPLAQVLTTVDRLVAYFPTTLTLAPNTVHRVVMSETTQSDTSSNYYASTSVVSETSTTYQKLRPMAGSWYKTYYDGSSWTETSTRFIPMWLILDNDTTYGLSSLASTDPGIANVRASTNYTIDDASKTGTAAIPTAANVRSGTATDATTGSLAVPAASSVRSGTATDATTGTLVVPAASDVRLSTAVDATTGTLDLPVIADVKLGVVYDNTTKTGTLSGSGPTAAEIADAVWDELLSGHTTAGSAGKALADAKLFGLMKL